MLESMHIEMVYLVALVGAFISALLFLFVGLSVGRRTGRMEAERAAGDENSRAREDAVKRSRATLVGQIGEQLAPYFPGFPGDPADARFLGKPVDFVVFHGASEGKPTEVVFVEVKTGDAKLSQPERCLRDAIKAGRVRWVEFRLPLKAVRQ